MVLNLSTEIWPIPAVLKFFHNTPLKVRGCGLKSLRKSIELSLVSILVTGHWEYCNSLYNVWVTKTSQTTHTVPNKTYYFLGTFDNIFGQ